MMQETPLPRGAKADRAERSARRKRLILIGSLVLALFIGTAFAAKPAYHLLKARRGAQMAAQGEALFRAGKPNEAAAKYRAALQLDPLGYRPLQGAARLASATGRPEAMDLWEQVVRLPQRSAQDRQEYAALLLQHGRTTVAERMIEGLLQSDPDFRTLSLAARFSARSGDDAKALEFARLALSRNPEDVAARVLLAELLAVSPDAVKRAEARQILWLIASKDGEFKKPAIEALARAPDLSREEQERALDLLRSLPDASAIGGLLASELKLKLQPEAAAQIFDEASARWSQAGPADFIELIRWLNLHGQSERVLTLAPLERALDSEPLLLSRFDALANLNRWAEIDELLARTDLSLDPSVIESFRARAAQGRGTSFEADLHWERAVALAGADPSKLRFVANFAEQSKAHLAALRAYDQLARFPDQAAFAYRGRQRLTTQTGDLLAARTVAEKLSRLSPDDVDAQAQLAHLNLLLGMEIETNLAKAKTLVAKYPNRLSFRVTAALGFLRQHDAASALAQFDGPAPIAWERTPPPWRAVYAAALLANEQAEAAHKIIATIPLDKLNNEERLLIEAE